MEYFGITHSPRSALGLRSMPRRKQVTVLVARFDDLVMRGLRALVDEDPNMRLVGVGAGRDELRKLLPSRRRNVALVDVPLPATPAEVRDLTQQFGTTHLVLLAERLSSTECAQLLAFGATACLSTSTQARDVLNAIHLASRDMQLAPRDVA